MAYRERKPKNYIEPGFYSLAVDLEYEDKHAIFEKGTIVYVDYKEHKLRVDDGEYHTGTFTPINEYGDFPDSISRTFLKTDDIKLCEKTLNVTRSKNFEAEVEEVYSKGHPIKNKIAKYFTNRPKLLKAAAIIAGFVLTFIPGIFIFKWSMGLLISCNVDATDASTLIKGFTGALGCGVGLVIGLGAGFGISSLLESRINKYNREKVHLAADLKTTAIAKIKNVLFSLDDMTDEAKESKMLEEQKKLTFGDTVLEQYNDLYLRRTVK